MDNNQPNLEAAQELYDAQIAESYDKLKDTHTKKEYTFSTVEKRRLAQQDLIQRFASQALQDLINLTVLPRVGIIPDGKVFTLYDINLGKLTVFLPKVVAEPTVVTPDEIIPPNSEDTKKN